MSKTGRYNYRRPEKGRNRPTRPERHITVRSVKRTQPELRKLSRAVIVMALAEAEAEKAAEAVTHSQTRKSKQANTPSRRQKMTVDQRTIPPAADSLVWQQTHWPHPFKEAAALSLLTHWAAQKHAPQLVLEARSDVTGVEYLVGSQLRYAQTIRRSIEQLASGSIVTTFDPADRPTMSTARRVRLTTTARAIEPIDSVASNRSILSALTAVQKNERLVIQAILGPRRQPTLPPTDLTKKDQSVGSKLLYGILPDRRPDARQALTRKLGQHGFEVVLRLGVHAVTAERRRTLLLGLAAAMGTVEVAGVHLRLVNEQPGRINSPRSNWSLFMPSQHLSVPEISHLLALASQRPRRAIPWTTTTPPEADASHGSGSIR